MNMQIPRTLEPELMDDPDEATLYDAMDHSEVNQRFVDDLLAAGPIGKQVIDLGTGTARIPILLCQKAPETLVIAIDAAVHMLEVAIRNVDVAGLRDSIQVVQADAKILEEFEPAICDCLISNTLLHHLPEPLQALNAAKRLLRPGGRIFIRDLMRPHSTLDVEQLTKTYAGNEPPQSQQLLRQSLHAALTLDEAQAMAEACGINPMSVYASSDRHWTLDTTF